MNIKTLERAARRAGYIFSQEYDEETKETVYVLEDKENGETIVTNDKKNLAAFLDEYMNQ